jgi:hypothetical protein
VFDDLARTAAIIDSGEDAGVGGSINYPVDGRKGFEIGSIPNVPVLNFDSMRTEDGAIRLTSWPDEVFDSDYFARRIMFAKPICQGTTDKTTNACNEEPHRRE